MKNKPPRTPRLVSAFAAAVVAIHAADISPSEFKARRADLMSRLPDGIVLLHARSDFLTSTWVFPQDPSFYYFIGGGINLSSILALDAASREVWLFAPTKLKGYATFLELPTPGADLAARLGIEHAVPWEEFAPWIERRLASNPAPVLYVDDTNTWFGLRDLGRSIPDSNPPGLDPIEDPKLLWRLSLERRWPSAKIKSASPVIDEMRFVKSPAEIERMRAASKATVGAWFRGAAAIGNAESPRQIEAEVARGCIDYGAQGPAWWPGLTDYSDYYRPPKLPGGKLVELDLGCDLDRYQTDTKRMVPVSGHFTPEQKEIWEFFVASYRAGLAAIRDGARRSDIFDAMAHYADRRKGEVRGEAARKAAAAITDPQSRKYWLLHSIGLDCCEGEPEILRTGMIVAFEPGIKVEDQYFSIEDVTLVTQDAYEVLAPLPYEAALLERSTRKSKR